MLKPSVEYLYHFTCEKCNLWWSIALESDLIEVAWFCPWCGHKHDNELALTRTTVKSLTT